MKRIFGFHPLLLLLLACVFLAALPVFNHNPGKSSSQYLPDTTVAAQQPVTSTAPPLAKSHFSKEEEKALVAIDGKTLSAWMGEFQLLAYDLIHSEHSVVEGPFTVPPLEFFSTLAGKHNKAELLKKLKFLSSELDSMYPANAPSELILRLAKLHRAIDKFALSL